MPELELIRPSEAYLHSYLAACRENAELKVSTYTDRKSVV